MAFVNPWMLAGLAAVGVPVLFHLLRRKQAVPKRWAAFRLLVDTQAAARRARVEHWLLLALRMAVFALLVFAFARPGGYLGLLAGGEEEGKHVVVALDASYSMGAKLNDTPKFDLARERVLAHLDRLSMDRGTVLLFSDRPREPLAGFTRDEGALREAVERAKLSAGGTDGNAALRRAVALLRASDAKERVVLLYSDFQRGAWDLEDLARLDAEIQDLRLRLALVDLRGSGARPDNQAVVVTELESDVVTADQTVNLRVVLRNHTREPRSKRLAVWVDGQKRHDETVDLPAADDRAAGERELLLPLVFTTTGYHSGQVTLEPDDVVADDTRWFALDVVPKLQVLLVDGDPRLDPTRSETYFLSRLLRPEVSGSVEPTVVPLWDVGRTKLDGFDAVVLANVGSLPPEKFSELRDFVQQGGGLVWFAGDKVFPEDFLKSFTGAGTAAADADGRLTAVPEGIFPGYPAATPEGDAAQVRRLDPARCDWGHPVTRRFRQAELAAARFPRTLRFVELDATAVPLRYDDGTPALLERAFGAGRVLVFTSACDADWGDMMLTGSTAGLALQTIYYATGRGRNDVLNLTVGDDVRLRFPLDLLGREVRVTRPSGEPTRVPSRATRQGECVAVLNDASEAGLYRFVVDGGPQGALAVNFDPRESEPGEIDPAEIAHALGHAAVTVQEEDLLAGARPLGADGWLVLALVALAVSGLEAYVANRNL